MAAAHWSPRGWLASLKRWWRGHVRLNKKPTNIPGAEAGGLTTTGTTGGEPRRSEVVDHQEPSRGREIQPDTTASRSGSTPPETRVRTSKDLEHQAESVDSRQAPASEAPSSIDNFGEDRTSGEVTSAADQASEAPPPESLGHSQMPLCEGGTPIWLSAIKTFEKDHPDEYELIMKEMREIEQLKAVDSWDTWLNSRNLDEDSKNMTRRWLRKCKAYMPSVALIRSLAMSLSNLDPHKIAPPVTAGIFILVELCFGLVDLDMQEKAIGLLLKTNIIISKWSSREGELKRMKIANEPSLERVNRNVKQIEDGLEQLYMDSLLLVSKIYKDGRSRAGRSKTALPSGTQEWDRKHARIELKDTEYEQLRSEAESMLKTRKESIAVLDWIRDRKEDPEPAHQIIKERTGIDDTQSNGGKWFLQTPEFSSWMHAVSNKGSVKRFFWVKGSMGTGKTTLLCRTQSHYEQSPSGGIRLVPYYCHGSGYGQGPSYETVLRALCRRLAWTDSGRVAEAAQSRYNSSTMSPEPPLTAAKLWGPLLQELTSSSSKPILFLIDALDECKTSHDCTRLLEFLTALQDSQETPVYFLVSSRPRTQIGNYFKESAEDFDVIQPQTRHDMECFIGLQISSKQEKTHFKESIFFTNHALLEDVRSLLLKTAGGMFRWAQIWLNVFFPENSQAIRRHRHAMELMETLKDIKTLDDIPHDQHDEFSDAQGNKAIKKAYERLWEINSDGNQYKKLQFRLFQIITAAYDDLIPQSLLDAVRFDPDNPDECEDLDLEQLKSIYSGFLQVNSKGHLEYEHLSAKLFVREIKNLAQTSHRLMADIGIRALKRPSHRIWEDVVVHLMAGKAASIGTMASAEPVSSMIEPTRSVRSLKRNGHFGAYLYRHWLRHCQEHRDERRFVEEMGEFFQARESGLEALVTIGAETAVPGCRSTLIRLDGELRPDPFLCMVRFGFSPFSHGTRSGRVLLPGFDDAAVREIRNSAGEGALHVACEAWFINTTIVKELLEWNPALLTVEDEKGRIPLHYTYHDEIVDVLLDYELKSEQPNKPATAGLRESKLLHWKNNSGMTPMMDNILIFCGSRDCLRRILDEYYVGSLDLLLCQAVRLFAIEAVQQLVKAGANPYAKFGDWTAMKVAINGSRYSLGALVTSLQNQRAIKNVSAQTLPRQLHDLLFSERKLTPEECAMLSEEATVAGLLRDTGEFDVTKYLDGSGTDDCTPTGSAVE